MESYSNMLLVSPRTKTLGQHKSKQMKQSKQMKPRHNYTSYDVHMKYEFQRKVNDLAQHQVQ